MGVAVVVAEHRMPRSHTGELVAPTRPDGGPWRFDLRRRDATHVLADDPEDLLEAMLPGYLARARVDRFRARVEHAVVVATQLRAEHLAQARAGGVELAPAERDEMLRSPRQPAGVDVWGSPVPLVLLAVHYRPYTDLDAPTSALDPGAVDPRNLRWLRPGHPEAYLRSLAVAGAISLAVHVES